MNRIRVKSSDLPTPRVHMPPAWLLWALSLCLCPLSFTRPHLKHRSPFEGPGGERMTGPCDPLRGRQGDSQCLGLFSSGSRFSLSQQLPTCCVRVRFWASLSHEVGPLRGKSSGSWDLTSTRQGSGASGFRARLALPGLGSTAPYHRPPQ